MSWKFHKPISLQTVTYFSHRQIAIRTDLKNGSFPFKTSFSFPFISKLPHCTDCLIEMQTLKLLKAKAYLPGLEAGFWNVAQRNGWCPQAVRVKPPSPNLPINSENRAELVVSWERIALPSLCSSVKRSKPRKHTIKRQKWSCAKSNCANGDCRLYDDNNFNRWST